MPNHNAAVPSPELVDKEVRVLELRRMGFTWARIAEQVGYADHTGAYAAYKRAIKRTQQQPADELREQELDRIDRLQLALWPNAMKGNAQAVTTIIRLMERRARLLGLDMPVKIEQDITTWNGDESIDRAVRDLAALLRTNATTSASESSMAGSSSESNTITTGNGLGELDNLIGSRLGQDENGRGMDNLGSIEESENALGGNSQDPR